jgi:hypothetical protein
MYRSCFAARRHRSDAASRRTRRAHHRHPAIRLAAGAAIVVGGIAIGAATARGATTAQWLAPVSGDWTDASKWSTPSYPNNGSPPSVTYDARVAATGGSSYTVTLRNPVTLDSLTIDAPNATLQQVDYPNLTINGPLDLRDGTFTASQGQLFNATLTGSGGNFFVNGSSTYVMDAVTIDRTVIANSGMIVRNGVTLTDNGRIVARGTNTSPGLSFYGGHNVYGTGTIILEGGMEVGYGGGTLVLHEGVTLTTDSAGGAGYGYIVPFQYLNDARLENRGTIWARTPGHALDLGVTWTNRGVLKVSDGGILGLGGQFKISDIGTLQNLGGTVRITGLLNNQNTTLALDASTGSWEMSAAGEISGGTITTADGTSLRALYSHLNHVVLDNVNVQGDIVADTGHFCLRNGTTLSPTRPLQIRGSGAGLKIDQPTLAAGEIVFVDPDPGYLGAAVYGASGRAVTLGPGMIIRTGNHNGSVIPSGSSGSIVNQGLISAQTSGKTLWVGNFYPTEGTLTNTGIVQAINGGNIVMQGRWRNGTGGVIRVNSGGSLTFGGAFTSADIGTIDNPGGVTISVTGAIDNRNSTLAVTPALGSLALTGSGASITGGTLTTAGGARLLVNSALLDGVTLAGEMVVSGGASTTAIRIENRLHFNNGVLSFQPVGASGMIYGGFTGDVFDGTGELRFDGDAGNVFTIGQDLIIPAGITVRTGTGSGSLGGVGTLDGLNPMRGVLNQSLISAETPGKTITLYKLANQGTARAINGGTLTLLGGWSNSNGGTLVVESGGTLNLGGTFTTADVAPLNRTGGTVNVTGVLNNTGATLTLGATLGSFNLVNGTINGGVVETTADEKLVALSGTNALSGATLRGRFDVAGGTANFTSINEGVVNVNGGQLSLNTGWNNALGQINLSSGVLQFNGTYTLPGVMSGINRTGGDIYLAGIANNAGNTLELNASTGSWRLVGMLNGGDVRTRDGEALILGGTMNNVATLDGEARVLAGGSATINGGITLVAGSRIVMQPTTAQIGSTLRFGGTTPMLGGAGEVVFDTGSGSFMPLIAPLSSTSLTIGPDIVIRTGTGSGVVSGPITNQGTISSRTAGQRITISNTLTNQGLLEVRGDGTVNGLGSIVNAAGGAIDVAADGTFAMSGGLTWSGGTIGGAGGVSFNGNINVTGDATKIGPGALRAGNTFALAAGKKLDLTEGKLIFARTALGTATAGTYSGVQGLIQRGYHAGAWDGDGIVTSMSDAGPMVGITTLATSTAAASNHAGGTFGGVSVAGSDVLVMYTYAGDLNLDGRVDAQDYGIIDNWVQFPGTSGYANGDINYDGVIDATDYGIIDNTIQLQGPPIPTGAAGASPAGAVTAVPEPSGVSLAVASLGCLVARRRRRRRNVRNSFCAVRDRG